MATDAFNPVTPEKLIELAVLAHLAGNNLMIEGPPGCGKSDILRYDVGPAISAITNQKCGVAWLPNAGMGSPEWRGLPQFDLVRGLTVWMRPETIPDQRDVDAGLIPEKGVIIIDEFNQNHASDNAPLHQLLLGADFGAIKPAKGWTYALTGNRLQDGAMAQKTASSLMDRVILCTLVVGVEDWCRWARRAGIRADMIAYIHRVAHTDLFNFDPKRAVNATPRSWAMLSRQIDVIDKMRTSGLLDLSAVGLVGEAIGKKFVAFREQCRKLVKIEDIEKNPRSAALPDNAGTTQFLVQYCAYKTTLKNVGQIAIYLKRLAAVEWLSFYLGELRHIAGRDAAHLKFYKENSTLIELRKEAEVED